MDYNYLLLQPEGLVILMQSLYPDVALRREFLLNPEGVFVLIIF